MDTGPLFLVKINPYAIVEPGSIAVRGMKSVLQLPKCITIRENYRYPDEVLFE
jgi:hypothetical protein